MKKKKVLRVFEGFAGYGGGHFALDRLKEKYPNFKFEIIGYSEIDKYACELYDFNHKNSKGKNIKNFGDNTKLNPDDVPDFDIFMGAADHTIKYGIKFALRAGTNNGDFVVRKLDNIFHLHHSVFWNLDTFSTECDLDIVNHRETSKGNLATTLVSLL